MKAASSTAECSGAIRALDAGDSHLRLADEHPEIGALGPKTIGGSPVSLHLYVADVDAVVGNAVAAGATLVPRGRPVLWLATHKEDLTKGEILRRAFAQGN